MYESIFEDLRSVEFPIEKNETFTLKNLRPYHHEIGKEWFANLRMDIESLSDSLARQRQ